MMTWWWLANDLLMTRSWLDSDLMTWMTCSWLDNLVMTHISSWNVKSNKMKSAKLTLYALHWITALQISMLLKTMKIFMFHNVKSHFCSWNVKHHKMKSAKLTMPWIRYALFLLMKCQFHKMKSAKLTMIALNMHYFCSWNVKFHKMKSA